MAPEADGIHGCHHLVTGDLRQSGLSADQGTVGMVTVVGMHLRIDRQHFLPLLQLAKPAVPIGTLRSHSVAALSSDR
jgi:hypothetical protein